MTYADEVRDALVTERGNDIILQLMSLFESADIPVRGITIEVKVPAPRERKHLGTLFGNVNIEVTT